LSTEKCLNKSDIKNELCDEIFAPFLHPPVNLAHTEQCGSLSLALKREWQFKKWAKQKKRPLSKPLLSKLTKPDSRINVGHSILFSILASF